MAPCCEGVCLWVSRMCLCECLIGWGWDGSVLWVGGRPRSLDTVTHVQWSHNALRQQHFVVVVAWHCSIWRCLHPHEMEFVWIFASTLERQWDSRASRCHPCPAVVNTPYQDNHPPPPPPLLSVKSKLWKMFGPNFMDISSSLCLKTALNRLSQWYIAQNPACFYQEPHEI